MITIFTPTYNRADKLKRLYQSLVAQESHNFEWLIIDDGSTDDTASVVEAFEQSQIKIRYYKQPNSGKHRAYNRALQLAEGEYFFCVDSDDWLAKDAIEKIEANIHTAKFVLAYKEDEKGKLLSDAFPENIEQISLITLNRKYHCGGEFTILVQTDFAKKYLFPVFESEKFITESVVYDRMAADEKASLLPCIVTICEYQADGLSNNLNQIMKNNPAGYCLYFMQRIDMQEVFLKRLVTAGKYNCFCIFAKTNKSRYSGEHRGTVAIAKPLGWAFWLYYKLVRKF
jgi:glycosyltransferase involved in cell wall biosynthesis